jgi:hypothetical protein
MHLAVRLSYLAIYPASILRTLLMLTTPWDSKYLLSRVFRWVNCEQKVLVCEFASIVIYFE